MIQLNIFTAKFLHLFPNTVTPGRYWSHSRTKQKTNMILSVEKRSSVQASTWVEEWMNEWVSCVMASQCSWMAGRSHWRNRGVCKGSCAWATPWCCYCGSASDAPASASSPEPCWVEMSPAAAHMTHTHVQSAFMFIAVETIANNIKSGITFNPQLNFEPHFNISLNPVTSTVELLTRLNQLCLFQFYESHINTFVFVGWYNCNSLFSCLVHLQLNQDAAALI